MFICLCWRRIGLEELIIRSEMKFAQVVIFEIISTPPPSSSFNLQYLLYSKLPSLLSIFCQHLQYTIPPLNLPFPPLHTPFIIYP